MNFKEYFPQLLIDPNIIYMDHAATTMMPKNLMDIYKQCNFDYRANVHRSSYNWSSKISETYEYSRHCIKEFLGATKEEQIVFTSGSTESLNLIPNIIDKNYFHNKSTVKVLLTIDNHHSAICPWILLSQENPDKYQIEILDLNKNEELDLSLLEQKVKDKDIFVFPHVSNVTGKLKSINSISKICTVNNCLTIVDGCQYIPHDFINLTVGNVDFYVMSGHKIGSTFGVGILYIKDYEKIKKSPKVGGGSIEDISLKSDFKLSKMPFMLEPGTPNISGVVTLCHAFEFLQNIGIQNIFNIENNLKEFIIEKLQILINQEKIKVIGSLDRLIPLFSIYTETCRKELSVSLLQAYLNDHNVFVRSGCHCVGLLAKKHNLKEGSLRLSLNFSNTIEEINTFFQLLDYVLES